MSDWKAYSVCYWILITCYLLLTFFNENGLCCGTPEAPEDGYFSPLKPRYSDGDSVTYTCNEGFSLKVNQSASQTNLCRKNRWMNTVLPSCVKNPSCGKSGTPANGTFTRDEVRNSVKYSCKAGYILIGNNTRSCSRSNNWMPQDMPKCVTNLAYQKSITIIGVGGNPKSIVDGDIINCNAVVKTSQFQVEINMGRISEFTNINLRFTNGSRIAVGLKSSNVSTSVNDRRLLNGFTSDYVTTPLMYYSSPPGSPVRPEKAQHIFIDPLNSKTNNFNICELEIFNSLESTNCGTPDEPSNGVAINKSYQGSSRFGYQCNSGYFLRGSPDITCIDGRWSAQAPICVENPTTPRLPTTRQTIKPITIPSKPTQVTTAPINPTQIQPTSKDDDEDKEKVIGIMAIAIGATAASIVIIVAILIVVCIMRKYYKKKSRLPPCHAEHGPLCTSPHNHYPMYKEYSQPRSQDGSQQNYGEPPIHLYDSIRDHNLRFPLQRPSPDYDLTETVFNEGYGRRPPLPVPKPPSSSSGSSQQYEPLMLIRRNSNPYDEVNDDMIPGTSGRNEPDIMTSSRVDSLYIKGAPRTTL